MAKGEKERMKCKSEEEEIVRNVVNIEVVKAKETWNLKK